MNKYQEALNNILVYPLKEECPKSPCCQCETPCDFYKQKEKDYDILKKLVDKETPMKVLNRRKSGVYVNVIVGECPNCGKFIQSIDVKPNQCECRQEIDWSDDND